MKKSLILLLLCLLFAGCSSLRIVLNTKDNDGKRLYATSDVRLFGFGGGDVSVAMGAKVGGKDTVLAIVVTCDKDSDHGIFCKDDRMMIRLTDSTTITLYNLYDKEYEVQTNTVQTSEPVRAWGYDYCYSPWTDNVIVAPYEVYGFVPRTRISQKTNSYALYLISQSQIRQIIKSGVVKLRIEIEDRDLDMTYPENAAGIFSQLYYFLMENVRKGVVRSNF